MVVLFDISCIVLRFSVAFLILPFAIEEWIDLFKWR